MTGRTAGSCHPFRSPEARDRYLAFYDERVARWWPVESEDVTVHTDWGDTFIRVSGPAGAPALVLLPGSRSNSLLYSEMVEALSCSYRTYAIDSVFDIGRSVPSRRMTRSSEAMEWLDGLLDGLGLHDGVNLAGQSLGASLAADYALHAPDRLRTVVWIAPAGVVQRVDPRFLLSMVLCWIPWRAALERGMAGLMPVVAHSTGRPRELFEDFVEEFAVHQACYGPLSTPMGSGSYWDDAKLRSLKMPLLVVVGEHEKICSARKVVERLVSFAPGIEVFMVPGAGHDLCFAQPGMAAQRMLEFLAKSPENRPTSASSRTPEGRLI